MAGVGPGAPRRHSRERTVPAPRAPRWRRNLVCIGGARACAKGCRVVLRKRAQDAFEAPLQSENLQLPMTAMIASYAMYVCSLSLVGLGLWGMSLALGNGGAIPGPIFFIGDFTPRSEERRVG